MSERNLPGPSEVTHVGEVSGSLHLVDLARVAHREQMFVGTYPADAAAGEPVIVAIPRVRVAFDLSLQDARELRALLARAIRAMGEEP